MAAALSWALHHTPPLEDHGVQVALLAIAVATLVSSVPLAWLARTQERLPVVVAVHAGGGSLRPAEDGDLWFLTALHSQLLPHGFFAALGPGFLRAYLATFVRSPHAAALVLTSGDTPVGMIAGILRPHAHTGWALRHHGLRLVALGMAALLVRPRVAVRFARIRLGRYRSAWRRRRQPGARRPWD